MSTDLTLASAREERDALASRTDVLDKVEGRRALPDDMHVTTEAVANFFGVSTDVIRQTVQRNRDEFEDDGYRVVTRSVFLDMFEGSDKPSLPSTTSTIALFPRRAVLRVGMLLRDSAIARQVRDYLLEMERIGREMSEDEIVHRALQITTAKVAALEARIVADRPLVERAKNHASGAGLKTRQQFFREVKQWAESEHGLTVKQDEVMSFLSTEKLGLFVRGNRSDSGQATAWAISKGYARNKEDTTETGRNIITGKLTATGQEYAWERVVRHIDANGTLKLPRQIGVS